MSKFIDFEHTGYRSDRVPDHARESMENYLMYGWEPGGFMSAMFAGDLFRAASSGDQANGPAMQGIAKWIMHSAPHGSWGSEEAVHNWCLDLEGCRTNFRTQKEKEYVANALRA